MQLLTERELQDCGVGPDAHVLAAYSGGADSTALLHGLMRSLEAGRIRALTAAHYHHGLRGADADADEAFCREFCCGAGIPFRSERGDVAAFARSQGLGIEAAARAMRYAFLERVRAETGADCIATAHHADDQAETVLLHLLRGTGLAGLCGMQARTGRIVRPLLRTTRMQIEAYLAENGIACRTDASNADTAFLRNRIRHELLPTLAGYDPQIRAHLCETAALLTEDERLLTALSAQAERDCRRDGGIGRAALAAEPYPIRARVLLRLLREAQDGDVERADVRRSDALLTAQTGTRIELRGEMSAWVDAELFHVGRYPAQECGEVPFVPGETARLGRWTVRSAFADAYRRPASAREACVDAARVPEDAIVRTRRDGDRFCPLGGAGTRSLSDVLIDRKVPRERRDMPLLCSGTEVLFVPGYTVSEHVKGSDRTERWIIIVVEEDTGL